MSRVRFAVVAAVAVLSPAWIVGQAPQGSPRIQMPRQTSPAPPRDTSARPASPAATVGTAIISGRVVAADTGQPLRRATITATPFRTGEPNRRGPGADRSVNLSSRTDDDGRYTIAQVPAGEYTLTARRAGFVDASFGQITSRTPARRVTVADGARLAPLDFQLLRGGVITGRVVDDAGEPAERVSVRAMQQIRRAGTMRTGGAMQADQTDDQGRYRLFGLPPGDYIVVAEPSDRRGPMRARDGAVQGVDVDTIPTYGPGTVNPSEALRVQVQPGIEALMDVQLVAAKVATVSGRVLTSNGEALEGGMVRLHISGASYQGLNRGGPIMPGGHFEIAGVAPGTYTIVAQGMIRRPGAEGPTGPPAQEAAVQTIAVEGEDVVVPLVTTPGSTVRGRITVEGDASALADRTLRISSYAPHQEDGVPSFPGRGRVAPDLTFEITGLRGEQALTLQSLPEGWWVKDVRVSGQSALDGFDFGQGRALNGVELIVSTRLTGLAGSVSMPTGATAGDYAVVLFSEDETRWETAGPAQAAGARMVRPGLDGAFRMAGLRPGGYYVVAVPAADADSQVLADPDQLRELAGRARTVEIKEGEMTALTLTLVNR